MIYVRPNEFTRNPFIVPGTYELRQIQRTDVGYGRCPHGICSNFAIEGAGVCEEHALQILDVLIARKGRDYLLARAAGAQMAIQYERERIDRKIAARGEETRNHLTRPGWVYYIKLYDRIKIGFAEDVLQRTRAYPPMSELLASHPGTMELERQMHKKFRHLLAEGNEWFHVGNDLMAHIQDVLAKFPDQKAGHNFRKNTVTSPKAA